MPIKQLASAVVAWQAQHGRQGLPWQGTRNPYHVWLSEIMLQQTQVVTVQQYYPRFLQRFPDVASLAAAPLDDVLALWSGLGYYSRARNLHRCAQKVVHGFQGQFPPNADLLQTLPGIGRSTAAAIAAFCYGERVAILDANVKRVLTRVLGFDLDLAQAANERALWELATDALPTVSQAKKLGTSLDALMPRHTQAMMDLGATLCTTRRPDCERCPLASYCLAHAQGQPESYPVKTRKLKRSSEAWWLLRAQRVDSSVYLVQRPTPGVWAGLYSLPMHASREELMATLEPAQRRRCIEHKAFLHVLTHKDMHLHVVELVWKEAVWPEGAGQWLSLSALPGVGLPAPIRKLLA
ncbi:MAG: A/G-specific adenine glycosylase [Burkholderiaceae bacterium]